MWKNQLMDYSENISTSGKFLIKHKSKSKLEAQGKIEKNDGVEEPLNVSLTQGHYLNCTAMPVFVFFERTQVLLADHASFMSSRNTKVGQGDECW